MTSSSRRHENDGAPEPGAKPVQCACPVRRFPGGWWILHRCGVALPGMRLATAEERAAMDNLWTNGGEK